MTNGPIKALFLDIGGVLLTNGWDRQMRKHAVETFNLEDSEVDERHHLTFDTYEEGKLTLDEYLDRVIFYKPQPFTREEFKEYMFAQSTPYPETIDLIKQFKDRYKLKIVVVSNEGRELTTYRIRKFKLGEFVDFFISSCFVHIRKPDLDIYRIALDVAQVDAAQVAYIEDRKLFMDVAHALGIWGIHHTGLESTKKALAGLGLVLDEKRAPGQAAEGTFAKGEGNGGPREKVRGRIK
jgi:putative hydrolase of the HAD superfamily